MKKTDTRQRAIKKRETRERAAGLPELWVEAQSLDLLPKLSGEELMIAEEQERSARHASEAASRKWRHSVCECLADQLEHVLWVSDNPDFQGMIAHVTAALRRYGNDATTITQLRDLVRQLMEIAVNEGRKRSSARPKLSNPPTRRELFLNGLPCPPAERELFLAALDALDFAIQDEVANLCACAEAVFQRNRERQRNAPGAESDEFDPHAAQAAEIEWHSDRLVALKESLRK